MGESGLRAGDVEADDAAVAVPHRELGDLAAARLVPHRGDERAPAHRGARELGLGRALGQALVHGLDHRVEGEVLAQVLLRGVPRLGVDDAVGRLVEQPLAGHAAQAVGGLHHRDRVVEGLEVPHQGAGVGRLDEPPAERHGVGGR